MLEKWGRKKTGKGSWVGDFWPKSTYVNFSIVKVVSLVSDLLTTTWEQMSFSSWCSTWCGNYFLASCFWEQAANLEATAGSGRPKDWKKEKGCVHVRGHFCLELPQNQAFKEEKWSNISLKLEPAWRIKWERTTRLISPLTIEQNSLTPKEIISLICEPKLARISPDRHRKYLCAFQMARK